MGKSPRCHLDERGTYEGNSERSDCLHGRIRYLCRRRGVDHDKTGAHRTIVGLATDHAQLADCEEISARRALKKRSQRTRAR